MAVETVDALAELTSPATNDEVGIWDVSAGQFKKITVTNLLGAAITGGGTIALGGFTLTVPATGTVALVSSGDWTPTLIGDSVPGTNTYTAQVGKYIRIGNLIVAWFYVKINALGTLSTNVYVAGLPIVADDAANSFRGGMISYWGDLAAAYTNIAGYVVPNTTTAILRAAATAATTLAGLPATALQNGSELIGTFIYEV